MKKLRIAQVSPLRLPVPDEKRGGNERIISYLTEELKKRGHKVTLFASADSKTNAKLISAKEKSLNNFIFDIDTIRWNIFNHSFAFEKASEFDIIHCHWDLMGAFFQKFVKTPVVNTSHYVESPEKSVQKIYDYYKDKLNIIFISDKQKNNSKIKFKNNWVIQNGIPVSDFKFNAAPGDHLVWVGRMAPDKFAKEAIILAKKTRHKLLMAGQIEEYGREYFEKEIKPELNSEIQYVGELSYKELSNFYGSGKACLYPVGLATLESLACGTPVIGLPNKKINNKVGFSIQNIEQAVLAVKNISEIRRKDCRNWVEQNFSIERMVDQYEEVYRQILKKQK